MSLGSCSGPVHTRALGGAAAAGSAAGVHGPAEGCRRAWTALALLAISLAATPAAAAQDDCDNRFPGLGRHRLVS